jgi:hypothetical protein
VPFLIPLVPLAFEVNFTKTRPIRFRASRLGREVGAGLILLLPSPSLFAADCCNDPRRLGRPGLSLIRLDVQQSVDEMLLHVGSPHARGSIMKFGILLCVSVLVFGFAFTAAMMAARSGVAQEL